MHSTNLDIINVAPNVNCHNQTNEYIIRWFESVVKTNFTVM